LLLFVTMCDVLYRAPGCKVDHGKKTSCDGHCVRVDVLVNVDALSVCYGASLAINRVSRFAVV
jgi:hypothetical protein